MVKLEIALVTPWLGEGLTGATEATAWQLAGGLAARGHRVDVLAMAEPSSDADAFVMVRSFNAAPRDAAVSDGSRVFLQPLFGDEVSAVHPRVERRVHAAHGLIFTSEFEYLRARRRYGPGIAEKSRVCGMWLEPPPDVAQPPIDGRYVLGLGRRDESANTGLLIEAYREYRSQRRDSDLTLVLAGPGSWSYDAPDDCIVDLGDVPEARKQALLAHALAIFQPGYLDADSHAVMQSWAHGRPVAVNALALPAMLAVHSGGGGWTASSKAEWMGLFERIDRTERRRLDAVGARGRAYYESHATRDRVLERYEEAFASACREEAPAPNRGAIYQVLAGANVCDDRSRRAGAFDAAFRAAGFASEQLVAVAPPGKPDIPIVLHSFEPSPAWRARAERSPLALMYSEWGTIENADVAALVDRATLVFVDTPEYAEDVGGRAGAQLHLLPPICDTSLWDVSPDAALMSLLSDGVLNLLFVGPLSPASCCPELLAAFSFLLSLQCDARLIVADGAPGDEYARELQELADSHGLTQRFLLLENAGVSQLAALYRTASLFWSVSEAENALSPHFDAMCFDVPVLAYATPKLKHGMGSAGVLFTDKFDPGRLAVLAKLLIYDRGIRQKVLSAQRSRRTKLSPRLLDSQVETFGAALGLRGRRSEP